MTSPTFLRSNTSGYLYRVAIWGVCACVPSGWSPVEFNLWPVALGAWVGLFALFHCLVGFAPKATVLSDSVLIHRLVGRPRKIPAEHVLAIQVGPLGPGLVSVYVESETGSVSVYSLFTGETKLIDEFLHASAVSVNSRGSRPYAVPRLSLRALVPSLVRWAAGAFLVSCVVTVFRHGDGWHPVFFAVSAVTTSVVAHARRLLFVFAGQGRWVSSSFRPWFEAIERLPALPVATSEGPYRGPSAVTRTRD